ncbi:hypothetical protein [Isoptericola variabilis]|uniref:Uncharacterized protein n=1 Tax=Isoptericola variabilis (strain 225) TaxID=743718 RepID=F6FQX1_ISOV2|nr:hypothetical protein [Isoptericola variabilis]AEG43856.1 hypothetical protein Isova_1077 [Isoptericola variabilis 225]TWH34162.1 hypothetical protein L600_001300000690 [Isoptericola variabilis J7]
MDVIDVVSLVALLVVCVALSLWLSVRRRVDRTSHTTHDPARREDLLKISRDVDRGKQAGQGFFF